MKPQAKLQEKAKDPFFGLKYIAYCRTGIPSNEDDVDGEAVLNFAKWQICKVRNVLWNDPIWDSYTQEEIMIEFFAIKFDDNEELRKTFEASLTKAREADLEWFERKERELAASKEKAKDDIIKEGDTPDKPQETQEEFEDTFK